MSILNVKKNVIAFVVGMLVSSSSFAAVSKEVNELLTKKLDDLKVSAQSIEESPIKGLYEVLSEGAIYYLSEDGQFLISGNIYDTNNGMKNITSTKVAEVRKANSAEHFAKIKSFEKDMIIYKADNEKYVITAFTDITCAYCKKLHAEMADYNKLGITIRYLAFPRGGEKSNAYRNMVSVWCSDDPKSAMDDAKRGRGIKTMTCDNNVLEQYKLGIALGITGTPTMFLEDGTAMPGYLPADRLIQVLEEKI
ncbi:bifunctional protein-disulfide isomerase/oxidoreductase DsbC [Psychromonas sp. SR45-3]|uniref:bifunctional protein-disulfide isomerase/oxidoreductase DsbC n=1 Tax=Psychromonas sp. SR45-3 TaxID=2760930 RepID=UPI0015FAF953|nr:bifunctional protein-disulfide isomerase/oxidoreductase DsbC [Psychromonas sp. SR45-3]MBB1273917.1 bifunctional protein-disulfide isomerase/oxidoreductase DsbC [Psychromonas sp. SR45-3]